MIAKFFPFIASILQYPLAPTVLAALIKIRLS